MAATASTILKWLQEGPNKQPRVTHMLVVCDTFSHEDYPVYVKPGEDVLDRIKLYSINMQRVVEVYNFALPLNTQLAERRAWNL